MTVFATAVPLPLCTSRNVSNVPPPSPHCQEQCRVRSFLNDKTSLIRSFPSKVRDTPTTRAERLLRSSLFTTTDFSPDSPPTLAPALSPQVSVSVGILNLSMHLSSGNHKHTHAQGRDRRITRTNIDTHTHTHTFAKATMASARGLPKNATCHIHQLREAGGDGGDGGRRPRMRGGAGGHRRNASASAHARTYLSQGVLTTPLPAYAFGASAPVAVPSCGTGVSSVASTFFVLFSSIF